MEGDVDPMSDCSLRIRARGPNAAEAGAWCAELERMYLRWAERAGLEVVRVAPLKLLIRGAGERLAHEGGAHVLQEGSPAGRVSFSAVVEVEPGVPSRGLPVRRSYVRQPYTAVHDHRTALERAWLGSVLDGNLGPFLS